MQGFVESRCRGFSTICFLALLLFFQRKKGAEIDGQGG
jgi:hypothetical protein